MNIARTAVTVFAAVSIALLAAPPAHACGMSVRLDPTPKRPTPVQEIAKAERAVENGQNLAAVRAVLGSFPRIRDASAGQNALETRAMRVFALAIVRANGKVANKSGDAASTPAANLAWAVQSLRDIDRKRPNDPALQADLGEALSTLPSGREEAMRLLQGLAQKDLIGSPHAYAALARLHREKGDEPGAEAAIKRCEEMSKTPGVCRPKVAARA